METKPEKIYEYIATEETNYKTHGVPIIDGYEFKMYEHIRLSTLYKNSKFSTGKDDGNRPYKNIIRPIVNVAYRSEGFDVKDIEPYVNDADNYYKSLLVRKYHNRFARKNDLDTFIDEVVESYVDYGLALVKNVNETKPECVPLQRIAFCDQTDILSGAICEKHAYSPDQLLDFKGIWIDEEIDSAIAQARAEKVNDGSEQKAKTPGKYIEVHELHGVFPETWLDEGGDPDKYSRQLHIVVLGSQKENKDKNGITLFKGKEKESIYKALKRDPIYGRACGFGGIEELFESQIWTNYNEIQIKEMLDVAALMIVQTASLKFKGQNKITDLPKGTIVQTEENKPLSMVNIQPLNMGEFENALNRWEVQARTTGSANDAQLGLNPTSGTPFALQNLVVSSGQGLHEYRQGKIATFFGEIYRDWILKYLVKEMNYGDSWLEEMNMEEMQYIAESVSTKESNREAVRMAIKYFDKEGEAPTQDIIDAYKDTMRKDWMKGGNKRFIEIIKDEFKGIPIDVDVNVAGKQKYLNKMSSDLTNIFRQIFSNPVQFQQAMKIPGMNKAFNEILEFSGISPFLFGGGEDIQEAEQVPQQNPQQQMVGVNNNNQQ
jgi:hypothetical protein